MRTSKICRIIFILPSKIRRVFQRCVVSPFIKRAFGGCGKNVKISPECKFSGIQNIYVGNHVVVGAETMIMTTRAKVIFGDYVFFAPKVSVITGDHRFDILGKYMLEVGDTDKSTEDDQDVIFEGDNWIGTGAIVLKGVTVGRGSIVAAGSVVTKSIPPYSIVAGIPAKVIKKRFTDAQIKVHESLLDQNRDKNGV